MSGIDSRALTVALPGSGNIDATGTTTTLDDGGDPAHVTQRITGSGTISGG